MAETFDIRKLQFRERQMVQRLLTANREVNGIFRRYIARVSPIMAQYTYDPRGVWIRDKGREALLRAELSRFVDEFKGYVDQQKTQAWIEAEERTGDMIGRWADEMGVTDVASTGAYARNMDAMAKFMERKVAGMNLSDRVWNLAGAMQEQMEFYLQSGIAAGRSADQISRDVRQVLNEPDKRFRRVRDPLTGELKPSKPMENYHPGRGVYRSSYMNARRLARTEINMAYHEANMEMYRSSPVIIGYEVKLSAAHPVYDICDELQGRYPKQFTFHGWHPQCLCIDVPVYMTMDQLEAWENGENIEQVADVPERFKTYMAEHREQFEGWKKQPYFVTQNHKIIERVYAGKPALAVKHFTHPKP